jgi:hypothetical protein
MAEKLLRPAFRIVLWSSHLKKDIISYVCLPDKILPMDLYNVLSTIGTVDIDYSWLVSSGIFFSSKDAATFAFDNALIDKRVAQLTVEDFQGSWRRY